MKVGEHKRLVPEKMPVPGSFMAAMLTHERPGMLTRTVHSYLSKTDIPLVVFDDGSGSQEKCDELSDIGKEVEVVLLRHGGFCQSWLYILKWMRQCRKEDAFVLLEDDLLFAEGWMDVMKTMQRGLIDLYFRPGALTCLCYQEEPQGQLFEFGEVKAYQNTFHGFQANLVSRELVEREDIINQAAEEVRSGPGRFGFDKHWMQGIMHRLHAINLTCTRSWVRHIGASSSLVAKQGYQSFDHPGYHLVPELESLCES